jgi:hypothetical protein
MGSSRFCAAWTAFEGLLSVWSLDGADLPEAGIVHRGGGDQLGQIALPVDADRRDWAGNRVAAGAEIDDDEGRRLVRIIRRGSGSVVTWRRAQMVLLSAQGMDAPAIAKVAFTSEDRVRDVIRNFSADGFGSLYPKYRGGHPPKFTLGQRREIKKIAKSRPAEHDLPFPNLEPGQAGRFPGRRGGGR